MRATVERLPDGVCVSGLCEFSTGRRELRSLGTGFLDRTWAIGNLASCCQDGWRCGLAAQNVEVFASAVVRAIPVPPGVGAGLVVSRGAGHESRCSTARERKLASCEGDVRLLHSKEAG